MTGPLLKPNYRLVIFDFDGTLADSGAWFARVLNELAGEFGFRRLDEFEAQEIRKRHAWEVIKTLEIPLWKLPRVMRRVREYAARDLDQIKVFPGVERMLAELANQGLSLGIVSSNAEGNVRKVLGAASAERISFYRCGASLMGKAIKLRQLLRGARVEAARAIYIGDEIRDGSAARDAGLAFGAVAWGYTDAAALRAQGPDEFFQTVEEVAERLRV